MIPVPRSCYLWLVPFQIDFPFVLLPGQFSKVREMAWFDSQSKSSSLTKLHSQGCHLPETWCLLSANSAIHQAFVRNNWGQLLTFQLPEVVVSTEVNKRLTKNENEKKSKGYTKKFCFHSRFEKFSILENLRRLHACICVTLHRAGRSKENPQCSPSLTFNLSADRKACS